MRILKIVAYGVGRVSRIKLPTSPVASETKRQTQYDIRARWYIRYVLTSLYVVLSLCLLLYPGIEGQTWPCDIEMPSGYQRYLNTIGTTTIQSRYWLIRNPSEELCEGFGHLLY